MNKNISKTAKEAEKALKEAVREAIDKHAKMGVPAVFIKNNKLCYKMPNGTISYKPPKRK